MMTYIPTLQFRPTDVATTEADWLIVPVYEDESLAEMTAALDAKLSGTLTRLREAGDITGKSNETTPVLTPTGIAARRVLVVGLGKRTGCDRGSLNDAGAAASRAITGKNVGQIAAMASDLDSEAVAAFAVGLVQGCIGPGLRKATPNRFAPDEIVLVGKPGAAAGELEKATQRAAAESQAVAFARELVNTPPCDLYPETFAELAQQAVNSLGVECRVLDEKAIRAENMGALLGIAQGSDRPPRVVVLRYQGSTAADTLGLIGKGVTFDSGGLSLKTNEQMLDMKCDMAGAAAVLGGIVAAATMKLPVHLLGVLAIVENMPSGKSVKLGDVLRARNGKTIEILNTDAEGRVILADALGYAADLGATHLLDLATLTGACMVALGTSVAGLMSNDETWGRQVAESAARAGERVWPLPMWPIYDEALKSTVADVKNAPGNRYGGAITAAKFLEQFTNGRPWAHLDIAGPAWAERESATQDAGGTGFGVRTIVELSMAFGNAKA